MTLFNYSEYRPYIREYVKQRPKNGRGELGRMAAEIGINSTLLSQILSGSRDFSVEQAFELSKYMKHNEVETQYFSTLVQISRTSHSSYKKMLVQQLETLRQEALKLSRRVDFNKSLSEDERAKFYSSWLYSAVHVFTSLNKNGVAVEDVVDRFHLSHDRAREVVLFLLSAGLVRVEDSRFLTTIQSTFLEFGSPHLIKHHTNWRLRAIEKAEELTREEMMFSGQLSLSRSDFTKARELLAETIKKIAQLAEKSQAEDMVAFNLDWFKI